jgi:aspartate/methionine/tyrosine aminotransferase
VGHPAATFIQKGGAAALRRLSCHDFWGPPTHLELWRRELIRRLKYVNKELNEIQGFKCNFPESTFYLWPNFKELGVSTEKMYNKLVEKKVMVDPGTKYGPSGEGYVRIGMVQPFYYLEEACKRIKKVVSNL